MNLLKSRGQKYKSFCSSHKNYSVVRDLAKKLIFQVQTFQLCSSIALRPVIRYNRIHQIMEGLNMKKIFIGFIRGYQRFISPLFPARCRYHPTCSSYMIDAIKIHGTFKGVLMGTCRILRCHPFVKGGIDYVPKKFSLKRNPNPTYYMPKEKRENNEDL